MKKSELLEFIEENIIEILGEAGLYTLKNPSDSSKGLAQTLTPDPTTEKSPAFLNKYKKVAESNDDEFDIPEKEPSKSELKKIDKEFGSNKLAKKLSNDEKSKLDRLEAGIRKKLSNPTKDNIAVVKQLINKPEIKKLFKDGGKDLKALISDFIA
jgi:arsenate reductase-like glutaredoxin family protein